MTGGEALINQWHDRIIKGQANSTLTAKAASPAYLTPHTPHPAEGDSAKFWTAVRGLIDVNTQVKGNLPPCDMKQSAYFGLSCISGCVVKGFRIELPP